MPGEEVGLPAEHYIHESAQPKQHSRSPEPDTQTMPTPTWWLIAVGRNRQFSQFFNLFAPTVLVSREEDYLSGAWVWKM